MRNLVRRYVTEQQRKAENEGVTEDDVNEIKNDISAFRFEMIEVMRASGMRGASSASGPSGPGGKKNRQKERRLMKGFQLSTPQASTAGGASPSAPPANPLNSIHTSNEIALDSTFSKKSGSKGFSRIVKLVGSGALSGSIDKLDKDEVQPEGDGKKWGKLTITDALRTAKVPRLIRVDRTGGSEESHSNSTTRPASAMEDYDQPHSRSASKRQKYLNISPTITATNSEEKKEFLAGTMDANYKDVSVGYRDANSGNMDVKMSKSVPLSSDMKVEGIENQGGVTTTLTVGSYQLYRDKSKLQRTNRVEEDHEYSGVHSAQSPDSNQPKNCTLSNLPAPITSYGNSQRLHPETATHSTNMLLNDNKQDFWDQVSKSTQSGSLCSRPPQTTVNPVQAITSGNLQPLSGGSNSLSRLADTKNNSIVTACTANNQHSSTATAVQQNSLVQNQAVAGGVGSDGGGPPDPASNVPGLQPMSVNRNAMQTSGWL